MAAKSAGLLYRAVRVLMRTAIHAYYREFSIDGRARIPAGGPLLIIANHNNSIMDALTLALVSPRPIHFLAKDTLFAPGAKQILRSLGVIPIYRKQDDPGKLAKNRAVFAAAHKVLRENGVIGIFPEGISHDEPRLKELKSGFARIALEAEAGDALELGHDTLPSLGVQIIPVGIHKGATARFRGHLAVRVGEPIAVRDFFEAYRHDERAGVNTLVEALETRLKGQILNLEDDALARVTSAAHEVLRSARLAQNRSTFVTEVADKQKLGDALAALRTRDAEAWEQLAARLAAYRRGMEEANLFSTDLAKAFDSDRSRRAALLRAFALVLVSPLALLGFVVNYPAYYLTGLMSPVLSRDPDVFDTSRVLFGTLLFLLQSGLIWWGVARRPDHFWWQGLAAAVFLLLCGFIALIFIAHLNRTGRRLRLALMGLFQGPRLLRLRARRARLLKELQGL